MPVAEVRYRKTADGRVKIVALLNFKTLPNLQKDYGPEVVRIYHNQDYKMFGLDETVDGVRQVSINSRGTTTYLTVDSVIDTDVFDKMIKSTKLAGAYLGKAIKMVSEFEDKAVRSIRI